jgi:predicted nucleotidyltransferase
LQKHDVIHAAIFGSFVRGEEKEDSDLDVLVELEEGKSLLDLVALKLELEEVLERKIDVATYNALHPEIRERVLEEQIAII